MPVLALRARDLGADVSTAALVVGLLGVGMLLGSLPAGAVVARIGERRALLFAGLLDAAAMVGGGARPTRCSAWASRCWSAGWLDGVPDRPAGLHDRRRPAAYRARALAALGGSHRVGVFVGPLLGAVLIPVLRPDGGVRAGRGRCRWSRRCWPALMPDLGSESRTAQRAAGHAVGAGRCWSRTGGPCSPSGAAVVVIGASRSVRNGLLPLWADHVGISASTTSLIFALAAAIDIAFFFPGGWLMDRTAGPWSPYPSCCRSPSRACCCR